MMSFLQELQKQQQEIDGLLSRVERLIKMRRVSAYDADRVDYKFVDAVRFPENDNTARDVVFTIPEATDFVAERFSLYPAARFVTTDEAAEGPNEVVFRPCSFSHYEGLTSEFFADAMLVDCFLQFTETYKDENGKPVNRSYQNMPFPVELLFGGAVNKQTASGSDFGILSTGNQDPYYNNTQFPSAMLFDVEWYLPAGATVQCKIAPNFSNLRAPSGRTKQNEYELVAVLEGYKKVKR
jgi:hypothetical protein